MKLSDLFINDAMDLSLTTTSKTEALYHLANLYEKVGGVTDVQQFVERLEAREAQSTTGVGDEIAIPHAQHESIKQAAIVFGRSNEGIEWESFDGQKAKLIFMIAAPEGGGEHLSALAKLSSALMNPTVKAALLKAQSTQEILGIFQTYEANEDWKRKKHKQPRQL